MESYLIYIGKSAIAAGAFYLAFLLLFQNQKHFSFNRLYLPVSLALSFLIPLITFTTVKYIEPSNFDVNSFAYLAPSSGEIVQPAFVFEWYHYLFGLYVLGIAGFLFHLLLGHLKAINIIKKSRIQQLFESWVNITKKDVHPFSFFNKIVVSEKTLSHPDLEMIVSHENIHVREKHTLDILFTEIMFLFQWFNPFAWLIKDAVKNNLEYKTDNEIALHFNPKTYQLAMVTLADKQGIAPFLTALNGSQLKNRIVMMKKKTENKYAFVKQLVVLPLLAVLVMGLSNKEVKTEIVKPVFVYSNRITRIVESENVVKGKVINEKDEPISGVSVIIKEKSTGTITNSGGEYEIRLEDKNEILVFTKPGYLYREVRVKGREKINVLLYVDKKAVNKSVIVNGYATKQEADINNKLVNDSTIHINSDTKEPPLYIVDGVETDNIEVINPNNIESISVLKDKSATIVYGEKGKNGVILITTKAAGKITKPEDVKVTGFGTQIRPTTTFKSANNNGVGFDFGSFKDVDPTGPPLYIVDGTEITSIDKIQPDNIESIDVLKGQSATELYGEKGKNGVVLITTKKSVEKVHGNPLVIVDGQEYSSVDAANVKPEEVASMNVIKNEEYTKMYGEKANDGVIVINTKTKYNSEKAKPLFIVNGKETGQTIKEIDPETIQSVNVLKNESATKKYGEKGKNGVIEITLKNGNENTKITTQLELRKFFAEKIKYPVDAQENGVFGKIGLAATFDKNGKVISIEDSNQKYQNLGEIVATSINPGKIKLVQDNNSEILKKEVRRLINLLPPVEMTDFKGKTINIFVQFSLQE